MAQLRTTGQIVDDLRARPEFKMVVWDDKQGWTEELYPHIKEVIAKLHDLESKWNESLWKDG